MHARQLILALAVTALLGTAMSADAQRKQYRWVDEDGVVHYGDRIPPEYAQQEVDVVTERGIKVETLDARKTEEELAAQARREAEDAEARKQAEQRVRRDRMLRDTYTSVADLEKARDDRVNALESQIRISRNAVENLEKQVANLETDMERQESSGNEVPENLASRLQDARDQLEATRQFVESREQEQANIVEQFDADIERYKELRGID